MLKQFAVPEDIAVRVEVDKMRNAVLQIFLELGMDEENAERSTDTLLYADTRGIDSHGVSPYVKIRPDCPAGTSNRTNMLPVLVDLRWHGAARLQIGR